MTELQLNRVSFDVAGQSIIRDISATLRTGELTVILGSNGAGKSTLLRAALGLLRPTSGNVTLDGTDILKLASIQRARLLSYLPQQRPMAWTIKVRDVVALGRYAYGASINRLSGDDARVVDAVVQQCNLASLVNRNIDTLSGGETTRVHCARTFAAQAPLLLADEPTTALDPRHQIAIMQLLKKYVSESRGAVIVAHEPALAARFADRLIWMNEGRIIDDGSPAATLTPDMLRRVYGIEATISTRNGRPLIDVEKPTGG